MKCPILSPNLVTSLLVLLLGQSYLHSAFGAEPNWENALVTDRPDAAESSQVVGPSVLQIETSLLWSQSRDAADSTSRQLNFPTLLRFGLSDAVELRLASDLWNRAWLTQPREDWSGLSDTGLGLKWHTWSNERLSTALLFEVNVPTGDEPFTSTQHEFSATFALDGDLGSGLGLGTNWGVSRVSDETGEGYFTEFRYAVALGGALNQRWSWFLEVFGSAIPEQVPASDEVLLDGGFKFLLSPDMQLDLAASHGLTDSAPDLEVTLGWSYRLRTRQ